MNGLIGLGGEVAFFSELIISFSNRVVSGQRPVVDSPNTTAKVGPFLFGWRETFLNEKSATYRAGALFY